MLGFQKSLELKNAGFPQPTPEFGQLWYSSNGNLYIIGRLSPNADCVAVAVEDTGWEHLYDMIGFVFAPTATDILSTLEGCALKQVADGFKAGVCTVYGFDSDSMTHENPADACAEAYSMRFK